MSEVSKYDDLEIQDVHLSNDNMGIAWFLPFFGFGILTISKTDVTVHIDHEQMSRDFCKAVMNKLIDKYYKP